MKFVRQHSNNNHEATSLIQSLRFQPHQNTINRQTDPLPYLVQLTEPVLVIYGGKDEQRKENYRIVVTPNAGHALTDIERRELMLAFVGTLTSWLGEFIMK